MDSLHNSVHHKWWNTQMGVYLVLRIFLEQRHGPTFPLLGTSNMRWIPRRGMEVRCGKVSSGK